MNSNHRFDRSDCRAAKTIDKVACFFSGPDWEENRRIYTQGADEVTERCKRCGLDRLQPTQ